MSSWHGAWRTSCIREVCDATNARNRICRNFCRESLEPKLAPTIFQIGFVSNVQYFSGRRFVKLQGASRTMLVTRSIFFAQKQKSRLQNQRGTQLNAHATNVWGDLGLMSGIITLLSVKLSENIISESIFFWPAAMGRYVLF